MEITSEKDIDEFKEMWGRTILVTHPEPDSFNEKYMISIYDEEENLIEVIVADDETAWISSTCKLENSEGFFDWLHGVLDGVQYVTPDNSGNQ